jgi:Na+-driven multidrug efflux pump
MNLMYAIFFGAGVAAFTYSRMGRRLGYGNSQNVWVTVGVVFVLSTIFFFTILVTFLKPA